MSPIFISAIASAQAARRNRMLPRNDYSHVQEEDSSPCPVCAGILGLGLLGAVGFSFVPGVGTLGGFLIGIAAGLLVGTMYLAEKSRLKSSASKRNGILFNYSLYRRKKPSISQAQVAPLPGRARRSIAAS